MNVVINSNKSSIVQQSLVSSGTQSLAYSTAESFPILSKRQEVLSPYLPISGNPANQSETFNLPRWGFLYRAVLQMNFTTTLVAGDLTSQVANNLIRSIQFVCNGSPFLTLDGEAIKALVMDDKASSQEYAYRYGLPLDPTTENVSLTTDTNVRTYVPLKASWFQSPEKALNLQELEQIQVVVSYKTHTEAGLSAALSSMASKLILFKYMVDLPEYNKIITRNMSSGMLMEAWNTITEKFMVKGTGVNPDATQYVVSAIKKPVFKTHIFIAKTNTDGTIYGCPQIKINNISVSVGEQFLTNATKAMLNYERAEAGMTSHVVSNVSTLTIDNNSCYTIDWSLLHSNDSNNGLCAFGQLNKPEITLNIDSTALSAGQTANSYFIYLVHQYWNILSVDPASRVVAVRADQ